MAEGRNRFHVDNIMRDGVPDYLTTQRSDPQQVTFTRQQLSALETVFPEVTGADALTEAQVRHRLGQRSVVAFIRDRAK